MVFRKQARLCTLVGGIVLALVPGAWEGCAGKPVGQPSGSLAPGASGACPEWTRGKTPAIYPAEKFLVGVGVVPRIYNQATGEAPGRDAAQVNIAKQLLSRVASETITDESASSGGLSSWTVKQRESVATSLVGPGARTVDRCFDWESTTFYVLAVLDRKEAAARASEDFDAANRRGAEEVEAAEKALAAGRPLDAVAALTRAIALRATVEQQSTVLRALTATQAPATFMSRPRLDELATAIRARAGVSIAVQDAHEILAPELSQHLSRLHVEIGGDSRKVAVDISGKVEDVSVERTSLPGIFVAVARAEVVVKRRDTGTVLGSVVREGKGGAPSEAAARRKAATEAIQGIIPSVNKIVEPLLSIPSSTE
jgi:hypothetical protein